MNNLTNYERLLLADLKGQPQLAERTMLKARTLLLRKRITQENFDTLHDVYQEKKGEKS